MSTEQGGFSQGDLVFAKVRGYPPWPAKVIGIEMKQGKIQEKRYLVVFYRTYERATCKSDALYPYLESKAKYGMPQKRKFFNEALEEIEHKPGIIGSDGKLQDETDDNKDVEMKDEDDHSEGELTIDEGPKPEEYPKISTGLKRKAELKEHDNGTPKKKKRPVGRPSKESLKLEVTSTTPATVKADAKATKKEAVTPRNELGASDQDSPPEKKLMSRSGRMIKPKRFADEPLSLSPGSKVGDASTSPLPVGVTTTSGSLITPRKTKRINKNADARSQVLEEKQDSSDAPLPSDVKDDAKGENNDASQSEAVAESSIVNQEEEKELLTTNEPVASKKPTVSIESECEKDTTSETEQKIPKSLSADRETEFPKVSSSDVKEKSLKQSAEGKQKAPKKVTPAKQKEPRKLSTADIKQELSKVPSGDEQPETVQVSSTEDEPEAPKTNADGEPGDSKKDSEKESALADNTEAATQDSESEAKAVAERKKVDAPEPDAAEKSDKDVISSDKTEKNDAAALTVAEAAKKVMEQHMNGNRRNKDLMKSERKWEKKRNKVKLLTIEARMIEVESFIKRSLHINMADCEKCIQGIDELMELSLSPLMLKKNPEIVDTVRKLRRYVGNLDVWDLSDEEKETFNTKAETIRHKGELLYHRFKAMFAVPEGVQFQEVFSQQVDRFRALTRDLTEIKMLTLTRDPGTCISPLPHVCDSSGISYKESEEEMEA